MAIVRPKQVANQQISALHVDSSVTALVVHNVDASGAYVSPGAGSTQVSVKEILTSSGASVMDSTNNSIGVTIRAGSAAGTEYTDGDTDATPNGGGVFFMNGSNTMRVVSATTPLPVSGTFSASTIVSVAAVVPGVAATNLGKAEDAQHASGDVGVMALAVRRTTPTDLSAGNTDGDYEPLQVDANGKLYVTFGGASELITGAVNIATPISSAVANSASSAVLVRVVGGVSSAVDFQVRPIFSSTRADNPVDVSTGPYVISSVGGVVNVSTGPFVISSVGGVVAISTGPFAISSIAGVSIVRPEAGSTWAVRPLQSSQADLRATVYQSSATEFKATARLEDSSGVGIVGSTGPAAVGVNALTVRPVMPTILSTTVLITSSHSTALYSLISSAAGLRHKIFAYFVSSTHTNPSTLVFMSSNAIDRWHVGFGSGSSGMTGANMALSPPAWIFHGDAANAINVRIEGGSSITSTVIARISIGYFSEA